MCSISKMRYPGMLPNILSFEKLKTEWGYQRFWPDLDCGQIDLTEVLFIAKYRSNLIISYERKIILNHQILRSLMTSKNLMKLYPILKQTEICFWELIFCKLYKVIKFRYLLCDNTVIIPLGLCIFLQIRWSIAILSEHFQQVVTQ